MDPYASIGKRYLGGVIDYAVYWCVFVGYVMVFGETDDYGRVGVFGFKALPLFAWWFIYFPIVEGISGQTLGKRIVGTRVIGSHGRDVGLGSSFLRHLVDFIDMFFFGVVGILVMQSSSVRQRLGDRLANTFVVEDREAICIKCGEQLMLNYREMERGKFVCPVCKQENLVAQSLNKGFDSDVLDAR